ncbi:MAG TPA: hypothetical protein VLA54_07515 [Acidimicrobiia bacterium]|nr:hypothetical protein [Acidimicrobiia bacterium]
MTGIVAFFVCIALWVLMAAGIVLAPETIDGIWQSVRELTWWLQVPLWIILLPWMVGLWVWESSWPLWARVLAVATIAVVNLISFYPWKKQVRVEPAPNPERALSSKWG